ERAQDCALEIYQLTNLPNYQIVLRHSDLRCDALGDKRFDHVAFLYVIEVGDVDAAFHAVAHLAGVVFEALERADLAFVDLYAVAHQPDLGLALDHAIEHVAAGNRSGLGHAEGLAHLGPAQVGFLDDRLEQAGHGFLDLVLQLINDRMQPDIDLLHVRQLLRLALRTNVEADDHRVGSGGQQHVILIDGPYTGVKDLDFYFL